MRQLSLFDLIEPSNDPIFKPGDDIYHVILDVIMHYRISSIFSIENKTCGDIGTPKKMLWRYSLDGVTTSSHSVFGEYEMGDRWFSKHDEAMNVALKNRDIINAAGMVLRSDSLKPTKYTAFAVSGSNGQKLHCQVARIGPYSVVEKQPNCYQFLRVYENAGEAECYYKTVAKKLGALGGEPAVYSSCDVYRVSDDLWSSFEYAERHGDWSILNKPSESQKETPALTARKTRDRER